MTPPADEVPEVPAVPEVRAARSSRPDELDAVRAFRGPAPVFDPVTDQRIRSRILAAGDGSVVDLRDGARPPSDAAAAMVATRPSATGPSSIDPASIDPVPVPCPIPVPVGRSRSTEAGGRDDVPAADVVGLPAAARPPRGPLVRAVAGAAAVLVLLAVSLVVVRARGEVTETEGSAAAGSDATTGVPVDELAAIAAARADRALGSGEAQYTRIGRVALDERGGGLAQVAWQDERWALAEATGRERRSQLTSSPLGGSTPVAPTPAFDGPLAPETAFAGLDYDGLRALPTESAPLAAALAGSRARTGSVAVGTIDLALDLLGQPVAPPALRAALLQLLAERGLTPVGPRTDRAGRLGAGYRLRAADATWTVVIEAGAARLLEWERVDAQRPEAVHVATFLADGVQQGTAG